MTLCKIKERNNTLYNSIRSLFKQIKYKIEQDVIEPNVNSLVQVPSRPSTPSHVGEISDNGLRSYWILSIYENYDNMWNTGTWSKPIL